MKQKNAIATATKVGRVAPRAPDQGVATSGEIFDVRGARGATRPTHATNAANNFIPIKKQGRRCRPCRI